MTKKLIVMAIFRLERRAQVALRHAFVLAQRLDAPLLIVHADEEDPALVRITLTRAGFDGMSDQIGFLRQTSATRYNGPATLFVSAADTLPEARKEAPTGSHVLLAIEEDGTRPATAEKPRICLPFGSREAAAHAAAFAIPYARRIGATIVACHTTYLRTKEQGPVTERHLSPDARTMLARLKRLAALNGVELVVRLAAEEATIHTYATRVANEEGCGLIIVAQGAALRNGSAERIAATSNVPVLAVATTDLAAATAFTALDATLIEPETDDEPSGPIPSLRPWYRNPIAAELIAAAHYVVKTVVGLVIGNCTGSLVILSDAMHKGSDALQGILVALGMRFAGHKRPGYHFDLRSLETGGMLGLGALILSTAALLVSKAAVGLLAQWPAVDRIVRQILPLPRFQASNTEPGMLPWMAGFMAVSILLSLLVSRYQISVGKESKEAMLVADGEETFSDSITEVGALAGIIGAQGFGWRWADAVSALIVSVFVLRAGWEIFLKGWRSFFGKSLGDEVEGAIRQAALQIPGIEGVDRVVTSTHGLSLARCSLRIRVRAGSARHAAIRVHLQRIAETQLLGLEGVKDVFLDLVIDAPEDESVRFALACRAEAGSYVVVSTPRGATHLLICDQVGNDSAACEVTPHPLAGRDVWAFAHDKRVETLLFFTKAGETLPKPPGNGIKIGWTHSADPGRCLGVDLRP